MSVCGYESTAMIHQFGDCELDTTLYELRVRGEPQALEPQVFRLLVFLVENGNRVVTKDELMAAIWHDRIVSDSTLASRIKTARQAIGDSGERQALIQTVHGRGYRFVGAVTAALETPLEPSPSLEAPSSVPPPVTALGNRLVAGLAVLVALLGMIIAVWYFLPSTPVSTFPDKKSIAVLPFTDLSEAGDQAYFADGVAEDILNALAKVKDLRVAGRTSSFAFKGARTDIKTIGKQLNVATVLEGSIRRFQNRVRITTQLVDTSTGYHLWSETYDHEIKDLFAIQDNISRAVVKRLHIVLNKEEAERPLVDPKTDNPESYRLYLQGRYMWKRRYGDNLPQAIELFEQAIAYDPDFALGHSALAAAYAVLPIFTRADVAASYEAAERAAHAALQLHPELSEPLAVLGRIYSRRLQWRRAEQQFQRAVAMQPDDGVARLWYGVHSLSVGQLQHALTQFENVLSIDPAWGIPVYLHSEVLYALGEREAAIQGAERAIALDTYYGHMLLSDMAYEQGQFDQTIRHTIEFMRLIGASESRINKRRMSLEASLGVNGTQSAFLQKTEALMQAGKISPRVAFYRFYYAKRIDQAIELFDLKADPSLYRFLRKTWGPLGRPLRQHPKFAAIAADLGLIEFWREFGWPDRCRPGPAHGVQCD